MILYLYFCAGELEKGSLGIHLLWIWQCIYQLINCEGVHVNFASNPKRLWVNEMQKKKKKKKNS